ncbi:MAG: hypothetical protein LC737_05470, partial [Chloroflexi bacterium]|nr:hypothetical protein [Chloroflexota bacterium]
TNKGAVDHDWVLLGATGSPIAKVTAPVGQSSTTLFTAPAAGLYEIICDIANHEQLGMTGRATVR